MVTPTLSQPAVEVRWNRPRYRTTILRTTCKTWQGSELPRSWCVLAVDLSPVVPGVWDYVWTMRVCHVSYLRMCISIECGCV